MTLPKKKSFSERFNETINTTKSGMWVVASLSACLWVGIMMPQIEKTTDRKATELRTEFYSALKKMTKQQDERGANVDRKLDKIIGWMSFINSTQDPKELEKFQNEYNFLNK